MEDLSTRLNNATIDTDTEDTGQEEALRFAHDLLGGRNVATVIAPNMTTVEVTQEEVVVAHLKWQGRGRQQKEILIKTFPNYNYLYASSTPPIKFRKHYKKKVETAQPATTTLINNDLLDEIKDRKKQRIEQQKHKQVEAAAAPNTEQRFCTHIGCSSPAGNELYCKHHWIVAFHKELTRLSKHALNTGIVSQYIQPPGYKKAECCLFPNCGVRYPLHYGLCIDHLIYATKTCVNMGRELKIWDDTVYIDTMTYNGRGEPSFCNFRFKSMTTIMKRRRMVMKSCRGRQHAYGYCGLHLSGMFQVLYRVIMRHIYPGTKQPMDETCYCKKQVTDYFCLDHIAAETMSLKSFNNLMEETKRKQTKWYTPYGISFRAGEFEESKFAHLEDFENDTDDEDYNEDDIIEL